MSNDSKGGNYKGTEPLVDVKKEDHLDEDPPLRAQNYACISFVSPEDVIRKREVFEISEFVKALGKDVSGMLDTLRDTGILKANPDLEETARLIRERYGYLWDGDEMQREYQTYKSTHAQDLQNRYHTEHGFQTSVRGVKIRGVYDTYNEAVHRCHSISKFDPHFNVYVAQVGCWLPWNPNPQEIDQSEYGSSSMDQLNTLMKKYKECSETKDVLYEQRKRDMMRSIQEQQGHKKLLDGSGEGSSSASGGGGGGGEAPKPNVSIQDVSEELQKDGGGDAWLQKKTEEEKKG